MLPVLKHREMASAAKKMPAPVRRWIDGLDVDGLARLEALAARRRRMLAYAAAHPRPSMRAMMEEIWQRDAAMLAELRELDEAADDASK
jgi:hypothetical protein